MKIQTDFYIFIPFENLLYVESYQAWDERIAAQFGRHAQQVVLDHYKDKTWAVLHDARKWELGTPAINSMIIKLLNSPGAGTITHHAYVTGPSDVKKWQVGKIFDRITSHEAKIFQEREQAEKWLSSFGYDLPDLP